MQKKLKIKAIDRRQNTAGTFERCGRNQSTHKTHHACAHMHTHTQTGVEYTHISHTHMYNEEAYTYLHYYIQTESHTNNPVSIVFLTSDKMSDIFVN